MKKRAAEPRPVDARAGAGLVLAGYGALSRGADAWDNDSSPQARQRLEAAVEILGEGPLGRVLEAGCGDGRFLARVAARAGRVLGLDLSAESVARARRRLLGRPGASVARANFLVRPSRGRFDLVCCLRVLADFEPPVQRRFLEKLAAAAAPGGRLLLMVPARRFRLFEPRAFLSQLATLADVEARRVLPAAPPDLPCGELIVLARKR